MRVVLAQRASKDQIKWGNNDDPNKVCVIGKIYEVESQNIRSMHTKITLVGVDGSFNSVCFLEIVED